MCVYGVIFGEYQTTSTPCWYDGIQCSSRQARSHNAHKRFELSACIAAASRWRTRFFSFFSLNFHGIIRTHLNNFCNLNRTFCICALGCARACISVFSFIQFDGADTIQMAIKSTPNSIKVAFLFSFFFFIFLFQFAHSIIRERFFFVIPSFSHIANSEWVCITFRVSF